MGKRRVNVILIPDEDSYVAYVPMFPSCTTEGDTPKSALKNAKEALELLFENASDDDYENLALSYSDHVTVGEVEIDVPVHAGAKT